MKTSLFSKITSRFLGLMLVAFLTSISFTATANAAAYYYDQSNAGCDELGTIPNTYTVWSDADCWDDMDGLKWNSKPGSSDSAYFDGSSGNVEVKIVGDNTIAYLGLDLAYGGVVTGSSSILVDFIVSGNTNLNGGFMNFGGMSVDINGDLSVGGSGSVTFSDNTTKLAGNLTLSTLSGFANGSGTVIFDGTSNALFHDYDGDSYLYDVEIDKSTGSFDATNWNADVADNVKGDFTMTSGTYSADAFLGIGGTYTQTGGIFSNISSSGFSTGQGFTQSGGSFTAPAGGDMVIGTAFTLTGGTFSGSKKNLTIGGALELHNTGVFIGNTGTIDVAGSFSLFDTSNFTSTSGFLLTAGNISMSGGTTFTHNSGYVRMDSTTAAQVLTKYNAGSFNVFEILMTDASAAVTVTGNIAVSGELILNDGSITGPGQFDLSGDYSNYSTFTGGTTLINITGTTATTGLLKGTVPKLQIDNPNMVLSLAGGVTTFGDTVDILQGVLKTYVVDNTNLPAEMGGPVADAYAVFSGAVTLSGTGEIDEDTTGETDPITGITAFSTTLDIDGGTFTGGATDISVVGVATQTGGVFNGGNSTITFSSEFVENGGTYNSLLSNTVFDGVLTLTTGSINVGAGTMDSTSGYIQNGGTFTGGIAALDFGAATQLNGGAFNAGSGTITFNGNFTQTLGTFTGSTGIINYADAFIQTGGTHIDGGGIRTYGDAIYLNGGDYTAGANVKNIAGNLEVSYSAPYTAAVSMANATSLTINGDLRMGNVASAVANFTLPSSVTNISGGIIKATGSSNLSFLHNNGKVYMYGSVSKTLSGDAMTFYDFTVNKPGTFNGQPISLTMDATIVEGRLYFMDGECKSSTVYAGGDFQYDAPGDGGSCIIEFNSTSVQTFNIDGTVTKFPGFHLNSATTTINLSSSTTNTMTYGGGAVTITAGTFNQNTTSLNQVSGNFYQNGGVFNDTEAAGPYTGSLTVAYSSYINGGKFNAPTGALSFVGSIWINTDTNKARDAIVDFSASSGSGASTIDFGNYLSMGSFESSGSVKASPGTMVATIGFLGSSSTTALTTFDANGGTVNIDGINAQNIGPFEFYNLEVGGNGSNDRVNYSTYTNRPTIVNGTLTHRQGSCYIGNIEIRNELVYTTGATGGYNGCTIFLKTSTAKTITLDSTYNYPQIVVDSPNTTLEFTGTDIYIDKGLVLLDGIINQGSTNIFIEFDAASKFLQNGGTFNGGTGNINTINIGNASSVIGAGTFNGGTGTYTFPQGLRVNYDSSYGGTADVDFSLSNLVMGRANSGFSLGKTGSTGSFIAPGAGKTFNIDGYFFGIAGGTTFDANGGTVTFIGPYTHYSSIGLTLGAFNNIVIAKDAGTISQGFARAADINGDLIIQKGILQASSQNINIAGDWTICPSPSGDATCQAITAGDAEFQPGSKTVTFDGGVGLDGLNQPIDQHINGSNDHTFYNFKKIATEEDTLIFEAGQHQIMTGTTTLQGFSAAAPLHLESSSPGSQWYFDPQGTRTFLNLTTKDSNNENAVKIATVGLDITDNGNNFWWDFPSAPVVSSLGPVGYVNGSATQERNPALTFNIDELNDQDIYYKIIINDTDDILTPIIEYTTTYMTDPNGGSNTFTVGQAAGTGTYQAGGGLTELVDGDYYWRVYASNGSLDSAWLRANNGSVAFTVDNIAPEAIIQRAPVGGYLVSTNTPKFEWTDITGEASYTIEIATDNTNEAAFSGSIIQTISGIPADSISVYANSALTPGMHYWRIYATDAAGNDGSLDPLMTRESFEVINAIPEFSTYMYMLALIFGLGLIYRKQLKLNKQEQ